MTRRGLPIVVACLALASAHAEDTAEPGFEVTTYATGLNWPVAMAFAPDGRLFVGEKAGIVRIIENGAPRDPPFTTVQVQDYRDSGLLGLTVDPGFAKNHYVYVFATVSDDEQQIIRFVEQDGLGVERTLIKGHLPTKGTIHGGGGLMFGPDGKLYFSIGDNTDPPLAQDMNSLAGKISRINPDGSTPDDNPFRTATGVPRATWALGFRNPFRFCFAPDGRMFVMDVGSDNKERREEINIVRAGDDCGWPVVEGLPEPADPRFVPPIYNYHDEGASPTGGVYYTGKQFPAEYAGNLFHAEYVLNRIYRMQLDGDTALTHTVFVQGENGPVDLVQAPDGSLLYCELHSGTIKQIRSIVSDGGGVLASGPDGSPGSVNPLLPVCGAGLSLAVAGTLSLLVLSRRRA